MADSSIIENEAAEERIRFFDKKFRIYYDEGHLILARHAAFPLVVSVDLLYQLWANFKSYSSKWETAEVVPLPAVSDVLLSLFRQTGNGMYEMEGETRNYLLAELKNDSRFGELRLQELASFLYQYALALPDHEELKNFKETQRWAALLAVDPTSASQGVLRALAEKVKRSQVNASIGVVNLVAELLKENAAFGEAVAERLQPNATAITEAKGDMGFEKSLVLGSKSIPGAVAVKVNLPGYLSGRLSGIKQRFEDGQQLREKVGTKVYALLVVARGIVFQTADIVEPWSDTDELASYLADSYDCVVEQLVGDAVKENVIKSVAKLFRNAGADDVGALLL